MNPFTLTNETIDSAALMQAVADDRAGACVSFEGRVRNHHAGKVVTALEYEAAEFLACNEGRKILAEAVERFALYHAVARHRLGKLAVGEIAVAVFVSSAHRRQAFEGCEFIIDEIKSRIPIWKKEYYPDEPAQWVLCSHGGADGSHAHDHRHM
jgi:molybdopterin synthase catalytic subunit